MKKIIIFIISVLFAYPAFSFAAYSDAYAGKLSPIFWPFPVVENPVPDLNGKYMLNTESFTPPVENISIDQSNGKTISSSDEYAQGGNFDNFRRTPPRESMVSPTMLMTPSKPLQKNQPRLKTREEMIKKSAEIYKKLNNTTLLNTLPNSNESNRAAQMMLRGLGATIKNKSLKNIDGTDNTLLKTIILSGGRGYEFKLGRTVIGSNNTIRMGIPLKNLPQSQGFPEFLNPFQPQPKNSAVPMKSPQSDSVSLPTGAPTGEGKLKQNDSPSLLMPGGIFYGETGLGKREVPILTPFAVSPDGATASYFINLNSSSTLKSTTQSSAVRKVSLGDPGSEIMVTTSKNADGTVTAAWFIALKDKSGKPQYRPLLNPEQYMKDRGYMDNSLNLKFNGSWENSLDDASPTDSVAPIEPLPRY